MDLEELDSYRFWVLAQQDPKKFEWSSSDKAGTTKASRVEDRVLAFAYERLKATPIKGDVWTLAKSKGMKPVYQIEKDDGTTVFVNEKGDEVSAPIGMTFVKSRALKEAQGDQRIFVKESDE